MILQNDVCMSESDIGAYQAELDRGDLSNILNFQGKLRLLAILKGALVAWQLNLCERYWYLGFNTWRYLMTILR